MQIEERETKKRTEARESEGGRETVIRHVQKDRQTEKDRENRRELNDSEGN